MNQLNPTVVFNIGPLADIRGKQTGSSQASSVAIELPYAAFVLQATYPLYPNATNYFPIRRAANDTQYTIGRAFLQEAYITVDYERSIFHVSQATSKKNDQQLTPISSIDSTSDTTSPTRHISNGALPGIVIGSTALFFCLCALAFSTSAAAATNLDINYTTLSTKSTIPPQHNPNPETHTTNSQTSHPTSPPHQHPKPTPTGHTPSKPPPI